MRLTDLWRCRRQTVVAAICLAAASEAAGGTLARTECLQLDEGPAGLLVTDLRCDQAWPLGARLAAIQLAGVPEEAAVFGIVVGEGSLTVREEPEGVAIETPEQATTHGEQGLSARVRLRLSGAQPVLSVEAVVTQRRGPAWLCSRSRCCPMRSCCR